MFFCFVLILLLHFTFLILHSSFTHNYFNTETVFLEYEDANNEISENVILYTFFLKFRFQNLIYLG